MKSADKHEKIIRAATKVFAKKGFFNARISDIAQEAKIADGTIYLYFNNKFDILISVFEEEIGRLIEHIKKLLSKESDPIKMFEIFIDKHLRAMKKNRSLAEVIQVELRQSNKLIRDYRSNKFIRYVNIIADIIILGQQKNIFRKDINPDIAKSIIFGSLDEVARIWSTTPRTSQHSIEEVVRQVTYIFQTGILAPQPAPIAIDQPKTTDRTDG
jgi:TetR/AcrR family fatty acid metabolism transcriptional regulator